MPIICLPGILIEVTIGDQVGYEEMSAESILFIVHFCGVGLKSHQLVPHTINKKLDIRFKFRIAMSEVLDEIKELMRHSFYLHDPLAAHRPEQGWCAEKMLQANQDFLVQPSVFAFDLDARLHRYLIRIRPNLVAGPVCPIHLSYNNVFI